MELKAENINPFFESFLSVFEEMIGEKAIKEKVECQKETYVSKGFTVIVGIAEGGKGRVILDMDKSTAIKISEIVNEEKYEDLDDFVFITLSEIGNMIAGRGITKLNNIYKGLNLRLTPPSVFAGDEIEITSSKLKAIGVVFKLSFGEVSMNIAFD